MTELSNCCWTQFKLFNGENGLESYVVCAKCNKPCDVVSADETQCPTCGSWACWLEDVEKRISIDSKELLKQRVKLARAIGLLNGAKLALEITDDFDKQGLIKLIDEVLVVKMKEQVSVDDITINITNPIISPNDYMLACDDCCNHLIMDQRLLIKRDEYQRLKRLDENHKRLLQDKKTYLTKLNRDNLLYYGLITHEIDLLESLSNE